MLDYIQGHAELLTRPKPLPTLAIIGHLKKAREDDAARGISPQEDRLTRHIERLSDRLIKEFEEQRRNKQSARALFRSTVSEKLQSAHLFGDRDLRQWYNNIKQNRVEAAGEMTNLMISMANPTHLSSRLTCFARCVQQG